jgi:hypothetical protein
MLLLRQTQWWREWCSSMKRSPSISASGDIVVGPRTFSLTRPAVMVFRDEMPGANWMHPCTYALVDAQSGESVLTVSADRPPVFGRLPGTWVVAVNPNGRADLAP